MNKVTRTFQGKDRQQRQRSRGSGVADAVDLFLVRGHSGFRLLYLRSDGDAERRARGGDSECEQWRYRCFAVPSLQKMSWSFCLTSVWLAPVPRTQGAVTNAAPIWVCTGILTNTSGIRLRSSRGRHCADCALGRLLHDRSRPSSRTSRFPWSRFPASFPSSYNSPESPKRGSSNDRRAQRGATTIEMTLVGIPIIFLLISTFEISRGMWMYNTAATAVREGRSVCFGARRELRPNQRHTQPV